MGFARQASVLVFGDFGNEHPAPSVRSSSERRRKVFVVGFLFGLLGHGGLVISSHGTRLPLRQFDAERGAVAFFAGHANRAMMIADNRLHNRETQAGPLLLRGVVRR